MFSYEPLKESKRSVIVDTDIGPDVDDVGALVVLFKLAQKYDVPVLGIVNCTSNPYGNGAIDVVARYCGAEGVAIGQTAAADFLYDDSTSSYNKYLTEYFRSGYAPQGGKEPEEAVCMYRRLLANAQDKSVVIVTIGPLNNIGALLKSEGDEISPLSGIELIRQKVYAFVTMAGSTESCRREYNIVCDGEASALALTKLPVPIIFSGVELGEKIRVPFREVPENAQENPVYQAYRLYSQVFRGLPGCESAGYDLTAVQFAFEGEGEFYKLSTPGCMVVHTDEEYATEFVRDETGTHFSMERICTLEKICGTLENLLLHADKDWSTAGF